MTNEMLIDRFIDGDVQAFNLLVWRWQKPIYNFVLRYLASEDEAQEVTQKTFIKAYKKLRTLKDPSKFSSWLYQIALNLCHDESKRKRRRSITSLQTLSENNNFDLSNEDIAGSDRQHNPEKALQALELSDLLQQALQHIPEEQKTVVIMKELQGLKFTEIAEILNLPINTVKSRMYYGLHALRKVFKQWQIDKEAIHYEV